MKKAAVIYWSGTGNTEAMANAVLEGMKSAGADAVLLTASDVDGAAASGCTTGSATAAAPVSSSRATA